MTDTDPRDLIYTPNDIADIGTRYLQNKRANKGGGIATGLTALDRDFIPAMPGELITVIGRPGNGKTGFMMAWARQRAHYLKAQNIENRVVLFGSWEQSIEELYAFNVAADERLSITSMARGEITDLEWEQCLAAASKRNELPLWFIGHSLERRKKRPRIDLENLGAALTNIEKWNEDKTIIDMVFIDYLQRIPISDRVESKTIEVSNNLDRLKDGALAFGCPFIVGVQSRREVDQRDIPIPLMDDGQWTSNIEQASDKIFSVVRPAKYKKEGELFGKTKVEGNCQMLISLLKQKLGVDNKAYWVYFDPVYNKLDDLEQPDEEPIETPKWNGRKN
jgi:replicative DNA helicase